MKSLLFVGHPGHELMIYQVLKQYSPDVVFLTTGSGADNKPRIDESIKLMESLNLTVHYPFEPLSDCQIYNLILGGDLASFIGIKESLIQFVHKLGYELLIGDALEGFNPAHDICRYLINGVVADLQPDHKILNYDILLDQLFLVDQEPTTTDHIRLDLNEEEKREKIESCKKYKPIRTEVNRFIATYGEDFFGKESMRPVHDIFKLKSWDGPAPHYEMHGKKRISEGVYQSLILFETHIKPIAEGLLKKSVE